MSEHASSSPGPAELAGTKDSKTNTTAKQPILAISSSYKQANLTNQLSTSK